MVKLRLAGMLWFLAVLTSLPSTAQNIRHIGSRDGLSNSAVMSLFQDSERYLWMGTYDGLNRYDGTDIHIYKPDDKDPGALSGNVIRRIVESRDGFLWIMTKGGLNRFSKIENRVTAHFPQFPENGAMACDSRGNFFILTQPGFLFYYDFADGKMREMAIPDLRPTAGMVNLIIDADDTMWVSQQGSVRRYSIAYDGNGVPKLSPSGTFDHPRPITHFNYDKGRFIVIDSSKDLFIVEGGRKTFIRNISGFFEDKDIISCTVFDGDDIVIGFFIGGAMKLVADKDYAAERLPVDYGVFSMLKDDVQNILWVGTDGQGVYSFMKEEYDFRGINLEQLPLRTHRPVRAIYSEAGGDLWLGTKGNGIVRIRDYENAVRYDSGNVQHLTMADGLGDNSVFAFTRSSAHDLLWIGSSGPVLNYYSFHDNRLHTLRHDTRDKFIEVHSIFESDANTLWVSSLFSLYKLDIRAGDCGLEARSIRRYDFDVRDKQGFNKIYAICPENDSIMWLAMRGNGAIRFNNLSGDYTLVTFNDEGFAPMNDILCIHRDREDGKLWFGSSYGINTIPSGSCDDSSSHNYNTRDGVANNTIHGILESESGDLWFSSNTGLTMFDRAGGTFRNYDQKAGLKVIEFSDNAYFKEEGSERCFFGGIDGVVWIEPGEKRGESFLPPVLFTGLNIINTRTPIDQHMVSRRGREFLQLRYDQNFFTVSFSVNDFTAADKKFSYLLDGFSDVWINTSSREAQFSKIPPGRYELKVRYDDGSGGQSAPASLHIEILHPWYTSLVAKLLYGLALVGAVFLAFLYVRRYYERKRKKLADELSRKYKDEMYENKLRFFTNITHEFCTPLTLIHTPGERILSYEGSDEYIKRYARIILSNTERINTLVQEIIDFRRVETGNKVVRIAPCDISAVCGEIAEAFADLAAENDIRFTLSAAEGIVWNSDRSCITTILNNLVSNAFKYTERGGEIKIEAGIRDNELTLSVYNSGKGIRPEDISLIFNRYSVLDNVEQNMIQGISSRNGLGLAICKSMAELLGGRIDIESEPGLYARFIVSLPSAELPETPPRTVSVELPAPLAIHPGRHSVVDTDRKTDDEPVAASEDRPRILIVDDNEEILFTLREILSEEYTVASAKDGREGLERLTASMPDLVITDIMMPGGDGISMTKEMKLNPHTLHIPVVIISARSTIDDRIEGIGSGADAYISKPFDIQYLKTLVRQLIATHRKLRDYYKSPASGYDYLDGRLLPNETRDFIRQAMQIIDRHLATVEFTPEDLADDMHISLRTLYRRFKESGFPAPMDIIRRQRIEYAARLLLSTRNTIQEIMYMTGFTTRSHFYNEFTRRYGLSPTEYRNKMNGDNHQTL